jgi:ribonuclease-3
VSDCDGEFTSGVLETRLDYRFRDRSLLETALVHASLAGETHGGRGNERLEFLGDAVIDLVVARLLYEAHTSWDEGALTRARAGLVNRTSLADCARQLELGRFVRLGRTERREAGTEKDRILADVFEAVVGAMYLDGGLVPVEVLARRVFGEALESGPISDPKTRFQEWAHAELRETPRYRTVRDSGAEEDDQRFRVEVSVAAAVRGAGVGRSKQAAEREAAIDALARLEGRDA